MILSLKIRKIIILAGLLSAVWALPIQAQYSYRWMDVGSLHNFYSNGGTEIEQGFIDEHNQVSAGPQFIKARMLRQPKAFGSVQEMLLMRMEIHSRSE